MGDAVGNSSTSDNQQLLAVTASIEIAKKKEIPFHTDAAQSCGKVEVNVEKLQVDLLTIAGHKIYAPKGVGALYIRKGTPIENFVHGRDRRWEGGLVLKMFHIL
jgi:cysteine desulfurase